MACHAAALARFPEKLGCPDSLLSLHFFAFNLACLARPARRPPFSYRIAPTPLPLAYFTCSKPEPLSNYC